VLEPNRAYSGSEMERMMKIQDVFLKAMAKKIAWWDAAEIIGVRTVPCGGWRRAAIPD
jgi:hypothetical protein